MSDWPGVMCDRCSDTAVLVRDLHGDPTLPDGWTSARVVRRIPFLSFERSFCPSCSLGLLSSMERKP